MRHERTRAHKHSLRLDSFVAPSSYAYALKAAGRLFSKRPRLASATAAHRRRCSSLFKGLDKPKGASPGVALATPAPAADASEPWVVKATGQVLSRQAMMERIVAEQLPPQNFEPLAEAAGRVRANIQTHARQIDDDCASLDSAAHAVAEAQRRVAEGVREAQRQLEERTSARVPGARPAPLPRGFWKERGRI